MPSQEKRPIKSPLPVAKKPRIVKDRNIETCVRNEWSPVQRMPSGEWSQDKGEKNSSIKTKTTNDPDKAQRIMLTRRKSSQYDSKPANERQKGHTNVFEKDKSQNKIVKESGKMNLKTKNTKDLKISQLCNNSDSKSDLDAEDDDEDDEEEKEDDK